MTSISAERNALSQVGGTLRRREQWGARNSYTSGRTVVEPADHQFIHITVSNPRSYASNDAHARAIEAIGRARFPNTGISYNRLIMPDGAAYEAQPVGRRGAHTVNNKNRSTCNTPGCPSRNGRINDSAGNLNYNARAYVICQNVNDPVSRAQVESMARVMAADILAGFVKHGAPIHGHRCVAWKSCPADPMWAQMGELERLRDQYVRDGLTDEKEWWEMAIPDADVERIAKRAAEWAAWEVWRAEYPNGRTGKVWQMWQYLITGYNRAGTAVYQTQWNRGDGGGLGPGISGRVEGAVEKVLAKVRGVYGSGSDVPVKLGSPGAHRYAWAAMQENLRTQAMLSTLADHLDSTGALKAELTAAAARVEMSEGDAPTDEA